jgi:hypothetical protein
VELSPCLRPLAQTARAVFPQAAFVCGRHCGVEDGLIPRPPVPIDASGVPSMPAQGLSRRELIPTSVMYSPVPRHSALSHSTGPSPSARPLASVRRRRSIDDPRPFALISFKSTAPRSDSWHRFGRNFARAYIRAYRRMAFALPSPRPRSTRPISRNIGIGHGALDGGVGYMFYNERIGHEFSRGRL